MKGPLIFDAADFRHLQFAQFRYPPLCLRNHGFPLTVPQHRSPSHSMRFVFHVCIQPSFQNWSSGEGGQAACLLRAKHAAKHSQEEKCPTETSACLHLPSPSAEVCRTGGIWQEPAGQKGSAGLSWALGAALAGKPTTLPPVGNEEGKAVTVGEHREVLNILWG